MKPLRFACVLSFVLLAACAARRANPPGPEPEPAIITEQAAPAEAAPAMPTPPPDQPPPPAPDAPPPPAAGKPEQTDSGRFRISIASLDNAAAAEKWVKKAQDAGYRAEVVAFEVDGKTVQRVLLPGYESLESARAALPAVQQDLGAPQAWVTSRLRAGTEVGAGAVEPALPAPPPPEAQPAN